MKLNIIKPKQALNKAFLKVKPVRKEIETFKTNLIELLDRTNDTESEEFHKNLVADFLKKTYYEPDFYINTKGRQDLVIHNGNKAKDPVGVILETKKPTNKNEMVAENRLNVKAFQELVLYYLRERITEKNLEVKYLIITNINEWFIFNANDFEKHFAQNKAFVKQFQDFENGSLSGTKTDFFYKEIAAPAIDNISGELDATYFNIRDYEKALRNDDLKDDKKLVALFKLLSPQHVLKRPFTNDSNSLDKRFYAELLHIIGLSEEKEGSKKVIQRNPKGKRNGGSLLEDAIIQLDSLDKISRLNKPSQFGATNEERLFNVGLELCITWVNRILFLKLLEAQLQSYHEGDKKYAFLNSTRIRNYDDLNTLFFQVLARKYEDRSEFVQKEFEHVPYLNSSLFEPTDLEHDCFSVTQLNNSAEISLHSSTVLKDNQGKRRSGKMNTLEYFFAFLNAYDFSGEGSEDIQEDNKTLINASVLGLIFEKINGYKDGSFFTPGFITMYMCRETIRKAVVQKFNERASRYNSPDVESLDDRSCKQTIQQSGALDERSDQKNSNSETGRKESPSAVHGEQRNDTVYRDAPFSNLTDIYNAIGSRGQFSHQEANALINDVKICDPAVGSGHFLVSALNEMIAVKHELGVLHDRQGKLLRDYDIHIENDELIVTDYNGELFEYNPNHRESQRVQETLFHEKQTIIENCLFGVDINPNSVKICRLRLWIELLKSAYYKNETALETLPNIDINIKCGNSLISRFDLDADLSKALRKSKWNMDSYRLAVQTYRQAANKEQKREMERLIADIKGDFETNIETPFLGKLSKARGKVDQLATEINTKKQWGDSVPKKLHADLKKAATTLKKLEQERDDIATNKIYENAFEWRFEFPEVLDDDGNYVGFDVVIGNPPYLIVYNRTEKDYYERKYPSFKRTNDLYVAFIILANNLGKSNSSFSFITPNTFLKGNYFHALRNYIIENFKIDEIVDFGSKLVFDDANVFCSIINAKKSKQYGNWIMKNADFITKGEIDSNSNEFIVLNPLVKKLNSHQKFENYLLIKDVGFNYWSKGRGKKRGDSIGSRVFYKGIKEN
ncbi:MAG: Eco57I restriction-modification methylase domain-containing protein, partial [Crocinitomicaceae bacterium]|nr:Eco57I restriction-modification methylase domain-containing protein [Crocinitomicaceae bacterium]